ncbi:hypothetical protein BH708_02290 [Brachybacterium sp. P6-10-X1]|nr:hypothetical protein BH708_02290 [Brachybacterium sp. P6-10-X1]
MPAISPEDVKRVGDLLACSRSAETRRSYASAIRTFTIWCRERGYHGYPAAPDVIAAYIAYRSNTVCHATISRDVAAISAAHLDNGLADPATHHGVRQALRSAGRMLGTAATRRAAPITTVTMRRIIEAMGDLDSPVGKRDRAILLVGLAAAQRRSEIAALTTKDLTRREAGLLLRIRRSKTDQSGHGDLVGIPLGTHPETCPVRALEDWLEVSGRRLGDDSPVFSRIYNRLRIADTALSDRSIARIIRARATAAGITGKDYAQAAGAGESWVSGHSLRAGHATSAAEAGVDPMAISRTTRHRRLDSLARYVRPASAVEDSTAGQIGL